MRNRTIRYAIDEDTGSVISRIGSEVAINVLQYNKMQVENNFATEYKLEKVNAFTLAPCWSIYKWTRKIPLSIKNKHREFWGMKPLKRDPDSHELTAQWEGLKFKHGEETYIVVRVVAKEQSRNNVVYLKNDDGVEVNRYFDGMVSWLETNPQQII